MEPIRRSSGTTESERYLAGLADATFLKLWCYPNTYMDRKKRPNEVGKELCDLLVVCGDEVIIFSDKSITWPESDDIELSWSRWYRRAIRKSVDQIRGAERWLREFPERIFIDPACTQKLPVPIPPQERRRVHGIAIALGAQSACSAHWQDDDGSLIIYPHSKGYDHVDKSSPKHRLFALGDVDPDGPFVHVFDETALNLVMREMDTITDFVRYLDERKDFIRTERLFMATSEADLVSCYMQTEGSHGLHAFPRLEGIGADASHIMIPPGDYQNFITTPEYTGKKDADRVSYIWDRLIGLFVENVLNGTSVALGEHPASADLAEPALRAMAREPRLNRRALAESFSDALLKAEQMGEVRFTRIIMPTILSPDQRAGYLVMVLPYPTDVHLEGGYRQYRDVRVSMLETYCFSALDRFRHLKRMVGIALDASSRVTGRQGGSEDLMMVEIDEWTPELEAHVKERSALHDVLAPERIREFHGRFSEFPQPKQIHLTRHQRRAARRGARKAALRAHKHDPRRT